MRQASLPPMFLSVLVLCTLPLIAHAEPMLKQVHVITRHGSRRPLAKHSTTLQESEQEKSLLTAIGQKQHYQLGVWLQNRYSQHTNYAARVLQEFDLAHVRMESSQYERTISSASSLALGLFPLNTRGLVLIPDTPANIPIYTKEGTNDILIRAYDKCPTFQERLKQLYATDLWTIHEANHKPILQRLAQFEAFAEFQVFDEHSKELPYIPLKDVWNVYDQINVIKTECPTPTASILCTELPHHEIAADLDDKEWAEVKNVAHFAELTKYSPPMTEDSLAGPFLQQLFDRMNELDQDETAQTVSSNNIHTLSFKVPYKFYLTSAHYPTLLGLFSALGWQFSVNHDDAPVIPEYAAALIFELYQDDTTFDKTVKMFYKVGAESGDEVMTLKLNNDCPTDTGCPFSNFEALVKPRGMTSAQWCHACGNHEADVCMKQQLDSCSAGSNNSKYAGMVAPFFGGMAVTIVLYILVALCMHRNNLRARLQRNREADKVAALTTEMSDFKTPSQNGEDSIGLSSPRTPPESAPQSQIDAAVMA